MMPAFCPPYAEQATLAFLGRRCAVTDLSHTIQTDDPTFPGHQRTLIWQVNSPGFCGDSIHWEAARRTGLA